MAGEPARRPMPLRLGGDAMAGGSFVQCGIVGHRNGPLRSRSAGPVLGRPAWVTEKAWKGQREKDEVALGRERLLAPAKRQDSRWWDASTEARDGCRCEGPAPGLPEYHGWPTAGPVEDSWLLKTRQAKLNRHVDWAVWNRKSEEEMEKLRKMAADCSPYPAGSHSAVCVDYDVIGSYVTHRPRSAGAGGGPCDLIVRGTGLGSRHPSPRVR